MIESGTDVAGGSYEYGTGGPDLEQESFVFVEVRPSNLGDVEDKTSKLSLYHNIH